MQGVTQSEDIKQTSEPASDMTEMLELRGQEFKTNIIDVLRALMGKVGNMQESMRNVSTHMESLRRDQ